MAKFKDFVKGQAGQLVDGAINKALGNVFGGADAGVKDGFNVNNLVSALNKSGFAKSSHFEVFVFGPGGTQERDMRFRIEAVDLPGRNFILTEHKFTNIGPYNRMPIGQTYTDVTLTIVLSEDLREKAYFEKWQNSMIRTGSGEGYGGGSEQEAMLAEQDAGLMFENPNYVSSEFGHRYFDEFIGKIELRQYGAGGDIKSIHVLNEAYPTMIAPISMSWGSDDIARLNVTVSYKNYKAVFYGQNQAQKGAGFSFSFGKGGLSLGGSIPGIGNLSFSKGAGFTGGLNPGLVSSGINKASSFINSGVKKVANFVGF